MMQIDIDVPLNVRVAAALKGGPEHEFFTVMDGVTVREDRNKYPNSVFLFKGDTLVMRVEELKYIWCSYEFLWSKIEPHFDYSYKNTQHFIKRMVEKHFELKDVTTCVRSVFVSREVEKHFELKDVTPLRQYHPMSCPVEEYFKLKDVTPQLDLFKFAVKMEVEEHFKLKDVSGLPKYQTQQTNG